MTETFCYLLYCGNRTYIGATYDPHRRLEQHNGIRSGGALATHGKQWKIALYVSGFPDWNNTLSFEWAWKRESRPNPGVFGKIGGLQRLLNKRTCTSNAIPYKYWNSKIYMYISPDFHQNSEKIEEFRNLKASCAPTTTHLSFLTFCFQPFFPFILSNKMSVSSVDITTLAQKVDELALDLTTVKTQLAAALERLNGATPTEKKPRKPRARKTAVSEPVNVMIDGAAHSDAEVPKAEKKPRKPRAKKAVAPATEAAPASDAAPSDAEASKAEKKPRKPRAKKADAPATEAAPASEAEAPKAEKKPRKPRAKKADASATETAPSDAEPSDAEAPKAEKKPRKPRAKKADAPATETAPASDAAPSDAEAPKAEKKPRKPRAKKADAPATEQTVAAPAAETA